MLTLRPSSYFVVITSNTAASKYVGMYLRCTEYLYTSTGFKKEKNRSPAWGKRSLLSN